MQNPTSIDLILTNKSKSFENSIALETGLSDHHKMNITVLTHFIKIKTTNISYRSYKHFGLDSFRNELNISLHVCDMNNKKCDQFKVIFMSIWKNSIENIVRLYSKHPGILKI